MTRKSQRRKTVQGAEILRAGVSYRVWAPSVDALSVWITSAGRTRTLTLKKDRQGFHSTLDGEGRAGDLYKYQFPDRHRFPDPASRFQPEGVHGSSEVIDPARFRWRHRRRRVEMDRAIFYEMHLGTFTPEGTFRSAAQRLPELVKLGVNTVQLMPLADFPGDRNWGYDGVAVYAPSRAYGCPDDLRKFVDRAHALGLSVVLDVVYNHFGPDGNYLGCYSSAYFNPKHKTPWGDGFNFDGPLNGPVRRFFLDNLRMWIDDYRIDGFRLDATHAILDDSERHFLAEAAELVQKKNGVVIAEDERNWSQLLEPFADGGMGLDAVWADDFHHSVRVAATGERESYLSDFEGTGPELASILEHGWKYRGQKTKRHGHRRGTPCRHLPPESFVVCISNHDQTGNRAMGERFHQAATPESWRAAVGLLLLSPYVPLLFMGQEWNASTPFLYFTDHHPELGHMVTQGRRREFREWKAFRDSKARRKIPDPQAMETFRRSVLSWNERQTKGHLEILRLHQSLIQLRGRPTHQSSRQRGNWKVRSLASGRVLAMEFLGSEKPWLVLCRLQGGTPARVRLPAAYGKPELLLSTNQRRFGGNGSLAIHRGSLTMKLPEMICLQHA